MPIPHGVSDHHAKVQHCVLQLFAPFTHRNATMKCSVWFAWDLMDLNRGVIRRRVEGPMDTHQDHIRFHRVCTRDLGLRVIIS